MAVDDINDAIRIAKLKDLFDTESAQSVGDIMPMPDVQAPPQGPSLGFNPDVQSVSDYSSGGVTGSWEEPQPGAQPSALPSPSYGASDATRFDWGSMAGPTDVRFGPRAELVKLPPTGPVSMASRDIAQPDLAPPRATLVDAYPGMDDPDSDAQYFSDSDLGAAVKRAQLINLPPGTAPRAALVDPDRPLAPSATTAPQPSSPSDVSAPPPNLTFNPDTHSVSGTQLPTVAQALPAGAAQPIQPALPASAPPFQPDTSGSKRLNAIYNNPGAMGLTQSAIKFGATPSGHYDTGHAFAQFPTREAGAAAQFSMWQNPALYKGHTLASAITNWIGPGEHGEAEFIAQKLNIPLNTAITDEFLRGPMGIRLMQAQAQYEGQNVLTPEQWQRGQDWAYKGTAPTAASATAAAQAATQPVKGLFQSGSLGFNLVPADQTQLTQAQQADQANKQKMLTTLQGLPEAQAEQPMNSLYNRLNQPVEGVNDGMRKNFQAQLKQQMIAYGKDYYGVKDDQEAFKRMLADPTPLTVAGEIVTKAGAQIQSAITAFNQSEGQIDQNRLDSFAKVLHPEATVEGRQAFIKSITSISDPTTRAQTIGKLIADLSPTLQGTLNSVDIADSADRLADPVYQRNMKEAIQRQVDANLKALRPDPTLAPDDAAAANLIAQVPKAVIESMTGPIGQNLLLSEVYQGTYDRVKRDNPNMSDADAKDLAGRSSLFQLLGAEGLNRIAGGKLGIGGISAITNPATRILASTLAHVGAGGAAGSAQQIAANITEGRAWNEGLGQAAVGGAVIGLPGGVIAGVHSAPREENVPARAPEPAPVGERPPVEAQVPRQAQDQQSGGPPLSGEQSLPSVADSPANALGSFTTAKGSTYQLFSDGTTIRNKAARLEHPGDEGLKERSAKTVFLTQQNADALATPADTHWRFIDHGDGTISLATETDGKWGIAPSQRKITVSDTPTVGSIPLELWKEGNTNGLKSYGEAHFGNSITEVRPAPGPTAPITQEDVARRAYEISQQREQNGQPGDNLSDWNQAQRELAATDEPIPATAGEAEPIVSAIANRYTAERMARGELGQIDPSEGTSTQELVAQGLKMSPKQRERLIDNFVKGKGGDLDQQGAAIRAKEAFLSEQSRAASRAAVADPNNPQLEAAAKAANDEVTAFHNGPLKQFKRVWSDSGRVLQQELPLDYTTLNGMKEAYLKKQNVSAPDSLQPALQKIANNVSKAGDAESVAMNNLGRAIENEVQKQTRAGRRLPTDEEVRARLAEIMKDFPCPT